MGRTKVSLVDPSRMNMHAQKRIPTTDMEAMVEAHPHTDPPESAVAKMERLEPVKAAIEALPERERYVVEAKFWRGRGSRIVAREMGCSHQTVHRLFRSGMAKLEVALREAGFGE